MNEPKPYILMIDDDKDDLEMFSSELGKKGIRVKAFDSSTKALFYLTLMSGNMELPLFVILDYNMPKKNGQQVLRLIKDNKETKDIPVVIYSTGMASTLKIEMLESGALDCFDKPWNCRELNSQVEKFQELALSFMTNKHLA